MQEESKHLRYLQRVSLMQRSLIEDSEHVKASLRHTERLRERAQKSIVEVTLVHDDEFTTEFWFMIAFDAQHKSPTYKPSVR